MEFSVTPSKDNFDFETIPNPKSTFALRKSTPGWYLNEKSTPGWYLNENRKGAGWYIREKH